MMKAAVIAAGALALALPLSQAARAAEPGDLPAGTKWLVNVNVKAAQTSPMASYAVAKIAPAKRREAQAKLAAAKALFGIDLLSDVKEVLIAGGGSASSGGTAYIYASLDAERLTTILEANPTFSSADQSGFKLLSWTDDSDKKQKFGAFARPGLTVISDRRDCLVETLDVLAGKRPGLSPSSPLSAAVKQSNTDFVTLMAIDVPAIVGEAPKAQALRQAQALCLRLSATQPETLSAALTVTATNAETAQQIRQALMGIQALALLRAAEAPEQAALAQLAKVSGSGSTVGVTLDVSKSTIEDFISQRAARAAAPTAAPAAPVAVEAPALTPVN
jgi:hypothetical protein